MSMMTQYELLYIISATYTDEDEGNIELNVKALLEKHGATIDSTSRLGKFRFAYPIKSARHGNYVLVRFTSEGAAVQKIDEALRITPEVLRHLILRADEAGGDRFDLVQFTEVNVDLKDASSDDRSRRKRDEKGDERKEEIKSGVAVLEGQEGGAKEESKEEGKSLSVEELEKKIDSALQEQA